MLAGVLVQLIPVKQELLLANPALVVDLPDDLSAVVAKPLNIVLDGHPIAVPDMHSHPGKGHTLATNMAFMLAAVRHVVTEHARRGCG